LAISKYHADKIRIDKSKEADFDYEIFRRRIFHNLIRSLVWNLIHFENMIHSQSLELAYDD